LWDAIFRRMHSVKGSAATLGFTRIVDIAHAAENLIARLKGKEGKIERAEVDLLFAATDTLVKEIVKLDKKEEDESTITLVDRLAKAAQARPDPALSASPVPPPPVMPTADPSLPRLDVSVVLSKTCAAPGPQASMRGQATPPLVRGLTPPPVDADELRPQPTVRVRAEALDLLLDQAADVMHGIARLREAAKRLPEHVAARLDGDIDRLRRTARELHGRVMSARLTPFSSLTERLPRAVRDLAHRLEKTLELDVQGADVELDRTVIEALGDPL